MLLYRLAQNSAAQLLFLIDMTVEGVHTTHFISMFESTVRPTRRSSTGYLHILHSSRALELLPVRVDCILLCFTSQSFTASTY